MDIDVDFGHCEEKCYVMVTITLFLHIHPEALISSKYGQELLLSETYQENVVAIVIDA